jgi:hypothetical protein
MLINSCSEDYDALQQILQSRFLCSVYESIQAELLLVAQIKAAGCNVLLRCHEKHYAMSMLRFSRPN